jgi:hypothetical protein
MTEKTIKCQLDDASKDMTEQLRNLGVAIEGDTGSHGKWDFNISLTSASYPVSTNVILALKWWEHTVKGTNPQLRYYFYDSRFSEEIARQIKSTLESCQPEG